MIVQNLSYQNFRNLSDTKINFQNGINVICGDNAQGKTNLIECLWLFTGGKSFRGAKDNELINFEKNFTKIEVNFYAVNRKQKIQLLIKNGKRIVSLNEVQKHSSAQIVGCFRCVVFAPNHLTLIKSGPEERRKFIDAAICQIKPTYTILLSQYRHILNQRNTLLKDIPYHHELEDTLDIWNERLCETGAKIIINRRKYIKRLSALSSNFYDGISNKREKMNISYKISCCKNEEETNENIKDLLMKRLNQTRKNDIAFGFTSAGPHRDDLSVKINEHEAKNFASQGQQRSAVLSLKLAEAELLKEETKEQPVILLDDVLSELDISRQDYLLNRIDSRQVFITCCESEVLNKIKKRSQCILKVSGGNVKIKSDDRSE